jgi:hypothetical protein
MHSYFVRKIILVALILIMMASTVHASTDVYLESNKNAVSIGEQFEVSVIVTPDENIDTVAVDKMSWDSYALEYLSIAKGDLFTCSLIWVEGQAEKGNYVGLCWACGTPTNKQGILATLTFKALTNGTSMVSLNKVGIAHAGVPIFSFTRNCSIMVGSGLKPQDADAKTTEIPIYFFASLLIIIITIIGIILVKKGVKFPRNPKDPNK